MIFCGCYSWGTCARPTVRRVSGSDNSPGQPSPVFSEPAQTLPQAPPCCLTGPILGKDHVPQLHQETVDHRARTPQLPHPGLLTTICTHHFLLPQGGGVPALSSVSLPLSTSWGPCPLLIPFLCPVSSNMSFCIDLST